MFTNAKINSKKVCPVYFYHYSNNILLLDINNISMISTSDELICRCMSSSRGIGKRAEQRKGLEAFLLLLMT